MDAQQLYSEKTFQTIVGTFSSEALKWGETENSIRSITATSGGAFDFNLPVANYPISLSMISTKISVVSDLVGVLEKVDEKAVAAIPSIWIQDLINALTAFEAKLNDISNQCTRIHSANKIVSVDPTQPRVTIVASNGQQQPIDFRTLLVQFSEQLEHFHRNLYLIALVVKPRSFKVFTAGIRHLEDTKVLADSIKDEIESNKSISDELVTEISEMKSKAYQEREEVAGALSEVTEALERTKSSEEKLDEIVEGSESLHEKISGLAHSVQEKSDTSSDALDVILDAKEKADSYVDTANEYEDKVEKLLNRMEKIQEQYSTHLAAIEELENKATDMLSSANNAGLASAYHERMTETDEQLQAVRRHFSWSIVFLVLCALPLLFNVFFFTSWNSASDKPKTDTVAQVTINAAASNAEGSLSLQKASQPTPTEPEQVKGTNSWLPSLTLALFMLPAAWLARFKASEFANLFRLREFYAHKYSLAKSVEGFKKQAPAYADDIAASTYGQLVENPAHYFDGKDMVDHPNPMMDKLLDIIGGRAKKEE